MKIALAQINPTVGAFEKNSAKILSFAEKGHQAGADLVIFPELSLVGYPPLDLLEKDHFVEDNLRALKKLASQIKNNSILVGYVEKNTKPQGKKYHNAAALISNGKIISTHFKSLLPSYDVFDETRHFEPASVLKTATLHQHKFAVSICEDIWNDKDFWKRRLYEKDPLPELFKRGESFLINISSSPYAIGKQTLRTDLLKALAKKYKTPMIYVNQVGGNDELIFDGASFALNKKGDIIAQCWDFREDLVMVNLDEEAGLIHPLSSSFEEGAFRALVLGIRDYVQKCGFKKVLIGLSGGIDSAVTAVLATEALGKENVMGVMMPSRYSSPSSLTDAEELAKNLGIKTKTIPIEPIFKSTLESLHPYFTNGDSDLAEQNVQARIRGNVLMALSNYSNALVLSTGNKSELATGYCTLYGDMSGGLSVLSDTPKTMVYKIAKFINQDRGVIPLNTISKAPTAELKLNQTDQDTLPPYDQLDKMIVAYVEEHQSIRKLSEMGFPKAIVQDVVTRIDRNEYKRRQAAPGLRLTHKAFGIGRRFPLAQQYREFDV